MQESLKKFGFCFDNNPKCSKFFHLKVIQLVLHSIIALVSGVLIVNKSSTCSVPISIFLLGIFGTTMSAVIMNFFMCTGRCCEYFGPEDCSKGFKKYMRGLNMVYFPLYFVFCVAEFIWYVFGAYWYSIGGDCSSKFSNGLSATIGLVAFYFILLMIYLVGFCIFLCYLRSADVPQPKPPEEASKPQENPGGQPNPADNTVGLPSENRPGDPDPRYNQGYPNDPNFYPPNQYRNDPYYSQPNDFQNYQNNPNNQGFDPRYPQNPQYSNPGDSQNRFQPDPRRRYDNEANPYQYPKDDRGFNPSNSQNPLRGNQDRQFDNEGYNNPRFDNQIDPSFGRPQYDDYNRPYNN